MVNSADLTNGDETTIRGQDSPLELAKRLVAPICRLHKQAY